MLAATALVLGLVGSVAALPAGSSSSLSPRAVSASSWTNLGCVTDGTARLLSTRIYVGSLNTPDYCVNLCSNAGYLYAGMQYGNECWCGASLQNGLGALSTSCTMACAGDSSKVCGNSYVFNLYRSPSLVVNSLGCYADNSNRVMPYALTSSSSMTVNMCLNNCLSHGYAYAGIEYAGQCYCASTMPTTTSTACTSKCNGDSTAACGGTWALNVYSLTTATATSATSTSTTSTTSTSTTSTTTPTTSTISTSTTSTTSTSTTSTTSTSSTTTSAAAAATTSASSTPVTSNAAAAAVLGNPAIASSSGSKAVYAHMMVGNTYTYTTTDWTTEITLAQSAGIDGFALNMGSDSWQTARIADAYTVAAAKGFKLFFSFDMSVMSCSSTTDAATLANLILTYASNSAQATYSSKPIVSTFSGSSCTFGQSSAAAGWTYVRQLVTNGGKSMYFVPAIFQDTSTFSSATWFDGEFNWNSGWPMGAANLDTSSDTTYLSALNGKGYMAAISPCFFTYYGPNSYNKDWIYRSDNWLLATRFESLLTSLRGSTDLVELVSWNDFGESHYLGSIAPATDQPNSTGWVNGFPHTAWLSLVEYYATAWKTGAYPAAADALWLWSRPHPKAATASAPTNARPTGWANTDDNLYVVVTLASPAQVTVAAGANTATWNLPAGMSKLAVASAAGAISASIVRSGATVKSYSSSGAFSYTTTPVDYNYNYFVASA